MFRLFVCCASLLLVAHAVVAADAAEKRDAAATPAATPREKSEDAKVADVKTEAGAKTMSGMSILGNQEAPKSLVIVPWKSAQIGDMAGLSRIMDDSTQPVDKEVFMRELSYYQIRAN